jgi:hypothetical protein
MAIPSPNMNLTVWNDNGDPFSSSQLAANFTVLDSHDHSAGRGVQVNTPGIANAAITTALLANAAVTNAILADNAVATVNIQSQAVTGAQIASQTVAGSNITDDTITYTQLNPTVIPLGSIALWWRAAGSAATPGGNWEIMDGRPWNVISNTMGSTGSALTTGKIPDMRGYFPLGADINAVTAPAIGASGGSATADIAHYHNVDAHAHTIGAHNHGIVSDGSHTHTWAGGLSTWIRSNSFDVGLFMESTNPWGQASGVVANTDFSIYIKNLTSNPTYAQDTGSSVVSGGSQTFAWYDQPLPMDANGLHSHTGFTALSGAFNTGATGTQTDTQLTDISIVPEYVALLFIMRVR